MKKDPLTQTSINSFFPVNNIKREPEDSMDFEGNPNAKRRKISNDGPPITIKNEPIDEDVSMSTTTNTFHGAQQPIIKTEPGYDSDYGGTEKMRILQE